MIISYHIYSGELAGEDVSYSRNMRIFGYRYARMIDYLQFGNEVLGGTGHVFIPAEAPGIGDANGGLINVVSDADTDHLNGEDYETAINLMLDWYTDEMEAARIGSALAGRPMRVVGPALQAHRTVAAWNAEAGKQDYDEDGNTDKTTAQNNRARYLLEQTAQRDNDDRAMFDQHMYYLQPLDVPTVIAHLLKLDGNRSWVVPKARTIFEWGPQVDVTDGSWWTRVDGGKQNIPEYFRDDGTPPTLLWTDFVNQWLFEQMNDTTAGFNGVLNSMEDNGFLHTLYFPPVQEPQDQMDLTKPSIWWTPALDPFSVFRDSAEKYIKPPYWSPLKIIFELEAGTHQVAPFDPHPLGTRPTCIDTCPDCANECSQ